MSSSYLVIVARLLFGQSWPQLLAKVSFMLFVLFYFFFIVLDNRDLLPLQWGLSKFSFSPSTKVNLAMKTDAALREAHFK